MSRIIYLRHKVFRAMKKWKEGTLTVYISDIRCLPFFSKWDQCDWNRDVIYLVTREDGLGIMTFIAIYLLPERWAVSVDLKGEI